MSLSLLVGRTVAIFTAYIYKHMFESSMSERSTLPESFLNITYMYDRTRLSGRVLFKGAHVCMYVCTVCLAGYLSVTDYRK